jgi:ribosomal-protein-alanine N-acetyltransferase
MNCLIETERLIIRELVLKDDQGMFELDSDKDVHQYLGNKPIKTIEQSREIINMIRQQYLDNGIGRWAVVEKSTNNFLGWTGFKLIKELTNHHINYYDLGYRLIKKYWGKGIATEAAKACLDYGFTALNQTNIYGMTDVNNKASRNVLEKTGLKYKETFSLNGVPHVWFELSKEEWTKRNLEPIS